MTRRQRRPAWLAKAGINLDLGCGARKQAEWVGMDVRNVPGVDIVHNLEEFPWPVPDGCCTTVLASHILEHIKPWKLFDPAGGPSVMSEIWRVLKKDGKLYVSAPHGVGSAFVADPTHVKPLNEATFQYFDPRTELYKVYEPECAFQIESIQYTQEQFLQVILRKLVRVAA